MQIRMKIIKEDYKKIAYCLLFVVGIVFFIVLPSGISFEYPDSRYYTDVTSYGAVMPIYPLFVHFMQLMAGVEGYKSAIVYVQGAIAIICIQYFIYELDRIIKLSVVALVFSYMLCLLPFTITLPDRIITQCILTEGLTYSLTYLFVVLMYKAMIKDSEKYLVWSYTFSMLLYLIRSQSIISILLVGVVHIWLIIRRKEKNVGSVIRSVLRAVTATVLTAALAFALHTMYINTVVPRINNEAEAVQESEDDSTNVIQNITPPTSQFSDIITIKGFFLATENDGKRYHNPDVEGAYERVYEELSKHKLLLENNKVSYADSWEGLGEERLGMIAYQTILDYNVENSIGEGSWNQAISQAKDMAVRLILWHPFSFFAVFVRLFFAALVAGIFFQPPSYLLICEIIALLIIILTACVLVIEKKSIKPEVIFIRLVSICIFVFAFIISAVHIPIQRYMVYFQGMFYIGWIAYLEKNIITRFIEKKNS